MSILIYFFERLIKMIRSLLITREEIKYLVVPKMKSKRLALIILVIFCTFSEGKKFQCNYKITNLPVLDRTSVVTCEFLRVSVKLNETFEIVYKEPSKHIFGEIKIYKPRGFKIEIFFI